LLCQRFCVQWRKSLNLLTFVCEIYLLRTTKIENCQQFLLSWIVCCSFDDYPSCRQGEGCLPLGKFCVPYTFANKVCNTNITDLRSVFPTQLSPYQKNLSTPPLEFQLGTVQCVHPWIQGMFEAIQNFEAQKASF
jgi:hypothetical protein